MCGRIAIDDSEVVSSPAPQPREVPPLPSSPSQLPPSDTPQTSPTEPESFKSLVAPLTDAVAAAKKSKRYAYPNGIAGRPIGNRAWCGGW